MINASRVWILWCVMLASAPPAAAAPTPAPPVHTLTQAKVFFHDGPDVAVGPDGKVLAAWEGHLGSDPARTQHLWIAIADRTGALVGAPTELEHGKDVYESLHVVGSDREWTVVTCMNGAIQWRTVAGSGRVTGRRQAKFPAVPSKWDVDLRCQRPLVVDRSVMVPLAAAYATYEDDERIDKGCDTRLVNLAEGGSLVVGVIASCDELAAVGKLLVVGSTHVLSGIGGTPRSLGAPAGVTASGVERDGVAWVVAGKAGAPQLVRLDARLTRQPAIALPASIGGIRQLAPVGDRVVLLHLANDHYAVSTVGPKAAWRTLAQVSPKDVEYPRMAVGGDVAAVLWVAKDGPDYTGDARLTVIAGVGALGVGGKPLREELLADAGQPVVLVAGKAGLEARGADGVWQRALVPGVAAASYDPRLDLVWLRRGNNLDVLDLRAPGATPVAVLRGLPSESVRITGVANLVVGPPLDLDYMIAVLAWGKRPQVTADYHVVATSGRTTDRQARAAEQQWAKRVRSSVKLVGAKWLVAQAGRKPSAAPAWAATPATPPAKIKLPAELASCKHRTESRAGSWDDDSDACGAAVPFANTGLLLVTAGYDTDCVLHDPARNQFAAASDPKTWSATSAAATRCAFLVDPAGTTYVADDKLCTVAAGCRALSGDVLGFIDGAVAVGATAP